MKVKMFNYSDFSTWADSVFENEFPNETIAISIVLYRIYTFCSEPPQNYL